jgi:hypothetical protein
MAYAADSTSWIDGGVVAHVLWQKNRGEELESYTANLSCDSLRLQLQRPEKL